MLQHSVLFMFAGSYVTAFCQLVPVLQLYRHCILFHVHTIYPGSPEQFECHRSFHYGQQGSCTQYVMEARAIATLSLLAWQPCFHCVWDHCSHNISDSLEAAPPISQKQSIIAIFMAVLTHFNVYCCSFFFVDLCCMWWQSLMCPTFGQILLLPSGWI